MKPLKASYRLGARVVRALPPGARYSVWGAGGGAWDAPGVGPPPGRGPQHPAGAGGPPGLDTTPLRGSAVRAINQRLDRGQLVALMCDLPPPGGGGVEVGFFGKRAVVPSGPAAIAIKRQVPLLPVFSRRNGPGH